MREFDALAAYPEPKDPRYVGPNMRTIKHRIVASYKDKEFYDGERIYGHGGLKYDGRWLKIAQHMIDIYKLKDDASVLLIGCDKGFLLHDFLQLRPKMKVRGTEIAQYPLDHCLPSIKEFCVLAPYTELPFKDKEFDLVLSFGTVYALNLTDAIKSLKEIQRVTRGTSFITLGAYENEDDRLLFSYWTLLGNLCYRKDEWLEVLKHCGYTGDYKFNTAKSLNLVLKKDG